MDTLRRHIPQVLYGAGGAVAVASLLVAGLSLQNPLMALVLVSAGVGFGGALAGLALLCETAARRTAYLKQVRANSRAQTEATLELLQDLRNTLT